MNFDENRVKTVKMQQYRPYNKGMECADSSRYHVKEELSHGRVIDSKRARCPPTAGLLPSAVGTEDKQSALGTLSYCSKENTLYVS